MIFKRKIFTGALNPEFVEFETDIDLRSQERRQSSKIERCASCVFFTGEPYSKDGGCRKNAPLGLEGNLGHGGDSKSFFPTVRKDEWCGQYQPRAGSKRERRIKDRRATGKRYQSSVDGINWFWRMW
jgi:hypothetical protein